MEKFEKLLATFWEKYPQDSWWKIQTEIVDGGNIPIFKASIVSDTKTVVSAHSEPLEIGKPNQVFEQQAIMRAIRMMPGMNQEE